MKNYITYRMYNANSKIFELKGFGNWSDDLIELTADKTNMIINISDDEVVLIFDDEPSNYFSKLTFDRTSEVGKFEATLQDGNVELGIKIKNIEFEDESLLLNFFLGEEESTILITRSKHYDN